MKRDKRLIPKSSFTKGLLKWNREQNKRQMPWKGEKDPYRIWLSEIILQQTRVEQGLHYYNNFIQQFPDVDRLVKAPEARVFKLWEGLGYYTRCRNLLATAKYIAEELNGRFPSTYGEIRELKGVGPYTAAAIASFAFNLPHAVVDGNVFRVLARVFGIETPTDSTAGKKIFTELAAGLLDKKDPGTYNQAIMDFGATVCKPQAPLCSSCIFRKGCIAFLQDKVDRIPVKEKKTRVRKRWFHYLVLSCRGKIAIRQRTGKDIWQGLYEFPLLETTAVSDPDPVLLAATKQGWLKPGSYKLIKVSPVYRQQLSHQLIMGQFIALQLKGPVPKQEGWQWIDQASLERFAFPRLVRQFMDTL